jgi:hypothetical protein
MRIKAQSTFSLVAVAAFALASVPAYAKWVSTTREMPQGVSMQVLKSDAKSTLVRFHVAGVDASSRMIDGREYSDISIPGSYNTDSAGQPSLPKITQSFMIPASASATLRVLEMRTVEEALGEPTPSKGALLRTVNPSEVAYSFAPTYDNGGRFPSTEVSLGNPFIMRDVHGMTVTFYPVVYDAATKLSKIVTDMTVEIQHVARERAFRLTNAMDGIDRDFMRLYGDRLPNFRQLMLQGNSMRAGQLTAENTKMLIITHDSFEDAMQPFVDWKTEMGFTVKMVNLNDIGTTYQKIKDFIKQEYDSEKMAYVILVGDAEQIPFHPGKSGNAISNEADPLYALTAGDDYYPDLFISRFSAKTVTQLETQITKSINYEKTPDENGDWYGKATGIASDEGSPTDGERAEILREKLLKFGYTEVDKLYDPGVTASDVAEVVNEGRSLINYIGHGSKTSWGTSYFANSNIDKLTNENKNPFIISVACVNGDFAGSGESFAERWLNAGTADAPKGAVAVFASSTNQAWVEPTVGQGSMVDLIVGKKMRTVGGISFNGEIAMLDSGMSYVKQTYETWHMFGDASLELRTAVPVAIQETETDPTDTGEWNRGAMTIRVGAEGLRAGLVQNGQLIAAGVSDSNGVIRLEVSDSQRSGEALLTITGGNMIPSRRVVNLSL